EAGWRFQPLGDFFEVGLLGGLLHGDTESVRSLPAPPFLFLLGEVAASQLTHPVPFQVQERHLDEFVPAFNTLEFAEAVLMEPERRFQFFEEKFSLPLILSPKTTLLSA